MIKRHFIIPLVIVLAVIILGAGGTALWNYHEKPQFCSTCHIMEPYVQSWISSSFLVKTHAEADITCLDCHEPTISQQVSELAAFISNNYTVPLTVREFDDSWCLRCHEHGNYEDIAERTAGMVVFGETVNPHTITIDSSAIKPHETNISELECSRCHKMHRESPGIEYCVRCHHEETFESCDTEGCHQQESAVGSPF